MNEEFCDALNEDLGRTPFASFLTEVTMVKATATHDLQNLKEWMKPKQIPSELIFAPCSQAIKYEPLGVVAVYGAWNAPLVTGLRPVIQAITAGNCVLVKLNEMCPNTSRVMKKFCDNYLDKEAVIALEGGIDLAQAVNKLKSDLICFTGSTAVGKIIAKTAAENLTPCILELGGKCPCVVDYNANIDFSALKIAYSKTANSG